MKTQGGAPAKLSDHWDAGCEFCTPGPVFRLTVVLSCWGVGVLGLRAAKASAGHLECWGYGTEPYAGSCRDRRIRTWQIQLRSATKSLNQRAETCQRDLLAFDATAYLNVQCACLACKISCRVCLANAQATRLWPFPRPMPGGCCFTPLTTHVMDVPT